MNEAQIWSAICQSVVNGHHDLRTIFLEKGESEFSVLAQALNNRNSLLHIAGIYNNPDAVKALLEAGASPFIKNDRGQTPLDVAHDNPEIRALLETAMKTATFVDRCVGGKSGGAKGNSAGVP